MKVRSLLLRAFRLLDFKNERGDSNSVRVCVEENVYFTSIHLKVPEYLALLENPNRELI